MSVNSIGSDKEATSGDYVRINWNPPGTDRGDSVSTKNATLALKTAIAVARAFDANCALRNPAKECTVPMFEPQELVLGEPLRSSGFFTDLALRGIKLTRNLQHGEFSEDEEEFRERFAERSIDGHYAVKFLQKGIYNSVHAASAASDMMMETKILMNLAPHPNICQIYGVTAAGSDAFLSRGKEGFYIILDRLSGTMVQRMSQWKDEQQKEIISRKAIGDDDNDITLGVYQNLMHRLEMALDIGSAMLFLSDRQIVFHLRPEKVGFDVRYSRIKLCDFGQARENGQLDQAPSLTKTDDIRTLAYTAPEVLCQAPVTVAADVYSYGVVLWEMLSLQRPFEGMSRSEHFERVIMEGERPPLIPMIPKAVQSLIEKCWDPHLRPTMKKVYDTVEEVLLFQEDKPDISFLSLLSNNRPLAVESDNTAAVVASTTQEEPTQSSSSKSRRPVRRTKTADGSTKSLVRKTAKQHHQSVVAASGGAEEVVTMQDKSKGSNDDGARRKSRKQGSSHDKHRSSNHEGMKDKSGKSEEGSHMADESSGSAPLKDRSSSGKSQQRVSRRTRGGKRPSSEESETPAGDDRSGEEAPSLPTIPSADEVDGLGNLPAFGRSATSENMAPREKPSGSSGSKGPAFGRSQTTSTNRRPRK